MMLGTGKAARLHTATAENHATYMEGMGKTDGWVATAAWTAGFALLLTVLTGGIWTALVLANLATTPAIPWPLPRWLYCCGRCGLIWEAAGGPTVPARLDAAICEPGEYRV